MLLSKVTYSNSYIHTLMLVAAMQVILILFFLSTDATLLLLMYLEQTFIFATSFNEGRQSNSMLNQISSRALPPYQ